MAVPTGHRLSRRRTLRLTELGDEAFIAGSATAEDEPLRAQLPDGFRPRVDIVAADWTGKLGCVAAGVRRVYAATVRGRGGAPVVGAALACLAESARTV
ncbi:hypothetical protein [Actinoplanes sp. TFC3]|uniref:hypothetical protein n=1 Tax=Actinoplanes sp. TFC3 TaxID=1710355 RepID=UPI000833C4A7|nr:hypothetical protein [Actinoplanes sp. TFC3]